MDAKDAKANAPSAFGRYTLLERLAVGGMAEVFRAKITSSHGFEKVLVIKRILPHLAADQNFVAMFIDEAKLTAQLTHPKIVQILDFGEVRGQLFTALEFVDGVDALGLLRTAARKRMSIPRHLAIFIVSEVLEALDYAHNARDMEGKPMQIVHRDISPSNIFLSKRGDVKLGDFGIAHTQRRESKTQAGTLKGKYGYMSPEQVVGRPIDARSDLFAIGVVLAELLTGRRLFTAEADLEVLLKVRDVKLERLDKYGADIPKSLDVIVRRALAKHPRDRYQTATELRDALANYLFETGQRVGPTELRLFSNALVDGEAATAAPPSAAARPARSPERGADAGQRTSVVPPDASAAAVAATARADARPGASDDDTKDRPVVFPAASTRVSDVLSNAPTASGSAGAVPAREGEGREGEGGGERDGRGENGWSHEPGDTSGAGGDAASAGGFTPVSAPGPTAPPASPAGRPVAPPSDVGRFVSGAPDRPPDSAGDVSIITPTRLLCDLALVGETGLLRFELGGVQKEIFLVGGAPESVSSNNPAERFGEYLVARGVLGLHDLELALGMLPHYHGKLGDTLVALGLLRPLDVFRLLSQQVRDRVIDVFAWTEGTFAFYRGTLNRQDNFPLGLDMFEILGSGVVNLSADALAQRFASMLDFCPVATGRGRLEPEAFRIGPTPREVLELFDGQRTLSDWIAQFPEGDERATFLRSLFLLVETDLVELD